MIKTKLIIVTSVLLSGVFLTGCSSDVQVKMQPTEIITNQPSQAPIENKKDNRENQAGAPMTITEPTMTKKEISQEYIDSWSEYREIVRRVDKKQNSNISENNLNTIIDSGYMISPSIMKDMLESPEAQELKKELDDEAITAGLIAVLANQVKNDLDNNETEFTGYQK